MAPLSVRVATCEPVEADDRSSPDPLSIVMLPVEPEIPGVTFNVPPTAWTRPLLASCVPAVVVIVPKPVTRSELVTSFAVKVPPPSASEPALEMSLVAVLVV